MNKSVAAILLLAGVVAVTAPIVGVAQNTSAVPAVGYRPGLGDLMTMTVQPRHIKLALAAQENNWAYAAYELHELEESFDRVARVWPNWKNIPIDGVIVPLTKGPMAALSSAIADGSPDRFNAAYDKLTEACNTCHHGANVGFVVIKTPDAPMFPDQDFRAVRR